MSVIAELTMSADEFLLGTALNAPPGSHIELERIVPVTRQILPFFWFVSEDSEARTEFESHVSNVEYVKDLVELDRVRDRVLYKVEWDEDIEGLIYGLAEVGATILEAYGTDEWYFRLRFPDQASLSTFHDYCLDHDIRYELERVSTETDSPNGINEFGLTPEQREAVLLAIESGYFDVPRGVTLDELAEELDVSQQAVSERIRRGTGNVLRAVMTGAEVTEP